MLNVFSWFFMVYDVNNVFAKILRNEIPCKKIYEDDFIFSFEDINGRAKIHILAIPKIQSVDVYDFHSIASTEEIIQFYAGLQKIIDLMGIRNSGFRLISNSGVFGCQEIMHFHFHILGGEKLPFEL